MASGCAGKRKDMMGSTMMRAERRLIQILPALAPTASKVSSIEPQSARTRTQPTMPPSTAGHAQRLPYTSTDFVIFELLAGMNCLVKGAAAARRAVNKA